MEMMRSKSSRLAERKILYRRLREVCKRIFLKGSYERVNAALIVAHETHFACIFKFHIPRLVVAFSHAPAWRRQKSPVFGRFRLSSALSSADSSFGVLQLTPLIFRKPGFAMTSSGVMLNFSIREAACRLFEAGIT
jgi:hypothetical protein